MGFKGNNAEKFATTLIVFIILLGAYILVCLVLNKMVGADLDSMVKDGMGFAVSGIAPVVAILLFSDWREEHKIKEQLSILDLIKNKAKEIEDSLRDYEYNIRNRKIELEDAAEGLADRENLEKLFIQLSGQYLELNDDKNSLKVRKILDEFMKEAIYIARLLYAMEFNSVIVKKYERLNQSRIPEDQIYPIPEKDRYESKQKTYKENYPEVVKNVDKLIKVIKEIKSEI